MLLSVRTNIENRPKNVHVQAILLKSMDTRLKLYKDADNGFE